MDGDVQGLDKLYPEIEPPFKKTKKKALDSEEKGYNQTLSRI
ncbi:MAG TPA: hypothetical protein PLY23_06220 [Alphaproteobacteria bacterium]|nr:hypothetical protein [Alphaproteobacteria bacterium]HQS93666.1 hypothetical protein [Alphaproteobacteria bacterium]